MDASMDIHLTPEQELREKYLTRLRDIKALHWRPMARDARRIEAMDAVCDLLDELGYEAVSTEAKGVW